MQRVVVIGGDAAGMSAAHQALRTAKIHDRELRITVLEKSAHTSYSACGIPYWIGGEVDQGADLVARTAQEHRDAGIDFRECTEAVSVDLSKRQVVARSGDDEELLEYDDLVLAMGAVPIVPPWARNDAGEFPRGVGAVKTIDDGEAWLERLADRASDQIVIVGGGYIGIEMAEAALRHELEVIVVTRSRMMSALDPGESELVVEGLRRAGVTVLEYAEVTGLECDDGQVTGVHWADGCLDASLVVLAIGVVPNTALVEGQIELAPTGALRPDATGRVAERVWAAGDCCEVWHRVSDDWAYLALGTHANKHGRVLGDNLGGGSLRFDGALGTAITRFAAGEVSLEIATTGLTAADAADAGHDVIQLVTEGSTASGYLAEAQPITIQIVADRTSRRLLGTQIVGGPGAGKRIDTAAAVLWHGGTVDDLAWMDLAYAPPFATAWEILSVAARRVAERL